MSQKRDTINDIAEANGFSTATVSYVLSGKLLQRINKQSQDTIRKKAEELNYLPNFLARSLKAGQSFDLTYTVATIDATGAPRPAR